MEYGSLFQIDAFARTWPLAQVAVGTRFAVQADQRSKPVVDRLMGEAYRWAQEARIQFCLLGCEPFLHGVFEHYGFREYLPPALLARGGDLLRMGLVLDVEPHQAGGATVYAEERPVDVHTPRLRKALGEAYENLVQTVRGTGYRFSTKS